MPWVIRVTDASGEDAYLRHGSAIGEGPIVRFPSKAAAEAQAEFLRHGLDEGETVTIVAWPPQVEWS